MHPKLNKALYDRVKIFPLYLFIFLAAFPALPIKYRSVLIIACTAAAIYSLYTQNNKNHVFFQFSSLYLYLPLLLFLLYCLSYLYSTDKTIAVFNLEKRLSLMAFPLIAYGTIFLPQFKNFRHSVLLIFIISCWLLILKTIIFIEPNQLFSLTTGSMEAVFSLREAISTATGLHPTYFTIYLLFSSLILIELIILNFHERKNILSFQIFFFLLTVFIFLIFSFIAAARTPLIAFAIALFLRLIISNALLSYKLALTFLLAALIGTAVLTIPSLHHRAKEVFVTKWEAPEGIHHNSTNTRIGIYNCSFETIKGNWLMGVGAGDSQYVLDNCYEQFNTPVYSQHPYNTHNQYLGIWLDTGILGLFIFVFIFFFGFYTGYVKIKPLQVVFFCFMAINMLTENILATQAGIVFFMYFYVFFYISNFSKKPLQD